MSLYQQLKGRAYSALSVCGFDHHTAQSKGFRDGWQMLIRAHNSSSMPLFLTMLNDILSEKQRQILLDGLANEYSEYVNWLDYVNRCCSDENYMPNNLASHNTVS